MTAAGGLHANAAPALALASRALREHARDERAFALRGGLIVATLVLVQHAAVNRTLVGAAGLWLFRLLVYADLVVVAIAATSAFSAVVAEEHEQGTLDLLRLTGLGPAGLLAGKCSALGAATLSLLAVQLPFAALSITLGGVSGSQLLAAFLVLGAFAWFALGIAVFASALCATRAAAALLAAALLGASLAVPALADTAGVALGSAELQRFGAALARLHAWYALGEATAVAAGPPRIGAALVANLVAGVAAFTAAIVCLRRRPSHALRRPVRRSAAPASRPAPDAAAFAWKERRLAAAPWLGLGARLVVYAVLLAFANHDVLLPLALVVACVEAWVACSRMFAAEVEARTLPLLVALPLPTSRWCRAKLAALAPALAPPAALVTLAAFVTMAPAEAVLWLPPLLANVAFGALLAARLSLSWPRAAVPLALVWVAATNVFVLLVWWPILLASVLGASLVVAGTGPGWILAALGEFLYVGFLALLALCVFGTIVERLGKAAAA